MSKFRVRIDREIPRNGEQRLTLRASENGCQWAGIHLLSAEQLKEVSDEILKYLSELESVEPIKASQSETTHTREV